MYPPFVQSFGDQFFAAMINMIGSVFTGIFNTLFSAISTTLIVPFLQSIGQSAGLPA